MTDPNLEGAADDMADADNTENPAPIVHGVENPASFRDQVIDMRDIAALPIQQISIPYISSSGWVHLGNVTDVEQSISYQPVGLIPIVRDSEYDEGVERGGEYDPENEYDYDEGSEIDEGEDNDGVQETARGVHMDEIALRELDGPLPTFSQSYDCDRVQVSTLNLTKLVSEENSVTPILNSPSTNESDEELIKIFIEELNSGVTLERKRFLQYMAQSKLGRRRPLVHCSEQEVILIMTLNLFNQQYVKKLSEGILTQLGSKEFKVGKIVFNSDAVVVCFLPIIEINEA